MTARNADALKDTVDQLEGQGHFQIIADLSSSEDILNLVETAPALDGIVFCAGQVLTVPLPFASRT